MLVRALGVLTVAAMLAAPAHAAMVLFEDFETVGLGPLIAGGGSERQAGNYYLPVPVQLAGWSTSDLSQTLVFEQTVNPPSSPNTAILLNATSAFFSKQITGFVVGQEYRLTLDFWGDNTQAPHNIALSTQLSGFAPIITQHFVLNSLTGDFGTVTHTFTAASTTHLLGFSELSNFGAVIDNIRIESIDATPPPTGVPEPGTLALLAGGLLAAGLARRKRA